MLKLTIHNGIVIDIDDSKIASISPHADKGSVIVLKEPNGLGRAIHVTETVDEVLKLSK
jgi:hypothetical protein